MLLGPAVLLLTLLPFMMVASGANRERAILEIVLYERNAHGEYETKVQYELRGLFSPAGAKTSAEGQIQQVHPLALCNDGIDDSPHEYGWVGVFILERPEVNPLHCLTLYEKTKHAIQRGATAVIFDVTDNEYAIGELRQGLHPALDRPVITVKGREAKKLRRIINEEKVARARIKSVSQLVEEPPKSGAADYFDMGIFLAFFILLCIIGVVVILKLRWRSRTQRLSMTDIAKRVVAKMETRKFRSPYDWPLRHSTSLMSGLYSLDSNVETCAICLEQYKDGQELRIIPCRHEFHRHCVDKWLIANRTCPLCLFNIIECPIENEGSLCSSPDPTNQQPEPPGVLQHVPGTSSSNYNNRPVPVPLSSEAEHPNYSYKFPVQSYAGYKYNEMADPNVHNVNRYSQTQHTSYVRDYYPQMGCANSAGASNFRQVGFGTVHPGLHCITTTTVGHGSAVLSPRSKSNMHRKMAHVHSPRARPHVKCSAANNGVTSSDSENEFTWLSYAQRHAPHLHDSRSQCDADVSGTSTDPDLDDNLLKSSDGSNVDVSNNSTFGSSHVVSDVSSFDSKAYMMHDSIGGAIVKGPRNNAGECRANMVSAHSLVQSMMTPNVVVGDSDASLVSVDTSAISPIDISDSWSDKTCDIVNFDPHSGCPVCRTKQLCDASNDAVTMTSVTSIACDVSVDHRRGHLRTSGVGQIHRRSLVYWHDKTNALNRGRCCYSLAARESPWQRSHISGHQMAWQQHNASSGYQHNESHRPITDDCPIVDCASEDRLAFDPVSRGNSRDFAAKIIKAAPCDSNHREACAMTNDHLVESYYNTKDKTDLLTTSRNHTRDQEGPASDQHRPIKDHRFMTRNHNSPARYNSDPPTDLTGLLTDHCGSLRDHCGNRDNSGPSMDDGHTDHCDPTRDNSGPWKDRNGLSREHRAAPKNFDLNGRTRFHSGLTRDLTKDHSGLGKDHSGPHRSHTVVEGTHKDIAREKCAKAKYYVGTKRDHRGSRCRGRPVNNPRIAQLTTAGCKETMVCQRSHGPVVTMSLGANASYHPSNVV